MPTFFITGIDTDIGKTLATGLIARYLYRQNKKVITQKPVQTGQHGDISEDILEHRRLMGIAPLPEDLPGSLPMGTLTCPYSFAYPASPHLAADLEGRRIDPENISRATEVLQKQFEFVLLEGAGGFLVPLTPQFLMADYVERHQYPVILVTSGRLGSINHTLLTVEAVQRRNLKIACMVFNQHASQDDTISGNSLDYFRRICPDVIVLPRVAAGQIPEIDFACLLGGELIILTQKIRMGRG